MHNRRLDKIYDHVVLETQLPLYVLVLPFGTPFGGQTSMQVQDRLLSQELGYDQKKYL